MNYRHRQEEVKTESFRELLKQMKYGFKGVMIFDENLKFTKEFLKIYDFQMDGLLDVSTDTIYSYLSIFERFLENYRKVLRRKFELFWKTDDTDLTDL